MRDQANVSDVECSGCAEPEPCHCPTNAMQLWVEDFFLHVKNVRGETATAQMILAQETNRKYDVLRIQRGKALQIFEFLGRVQGTLFRLQELYLGNKEMSRILQGDIARSIQRLHLVVEYLTPSLEKEEWKI